MLIVIFRLKKLFPYLKSQCKFERIILIFLTFFIVFYLCRTVESAPQLEDKITQTQQTEQDIERAKVNVEQNAKILGLIETLNMQRMAHLKFNTQHLTEQFQFVNDQFKKINHEIKQLGSCTAKRKVNLGLILLI